MPTMLRFGVAIVLTALSFVSTVIAEKNCTASNGYKYVACGDGLKDAQQKCCKAAEKCIQVKPFAGDDLVECSEARQLTNTKAVKIVMIPLFFMILEVASIVYLVLRCKVKESPVAMLCAVVIALTWPFLFCKYWAFGAYTMLLAMMVASAAASIDCPKMPWYTYRLIWALALFQIVALLGPMEAFHVPLFGESKAGNSEFIENVYGQAACDAYYDTYFAILPIEKEQKEFDPDAVYYGYCSKNWLATVQSFAVLHSLLWIGVVVVSGRDLLSLGDANFNANDVTVFVGTKEP